MATLTARMIEHFLVFDVHDPDDLGGDSRIRERFPRSNNIHHYSLRERLPGNDASGEPLTRLAMRTAGDLMGAYVADRFGTEVRIVGQGPDRFCLSAMLAGGMEMHTADGQVATAQGDRGLVYRGEPGTRFLTGQNNARWNLWITASRVERALEAHLAEPLREPLVFGPSLDLSGGLGGSMRRLLSVAAAEMARPDGLTSNPVALSSFTDLVAQLMLHGLPHSHTGAMARAGSAAVPRHLSRAEEFMRAGVDRPVSLPQIAAAAGCSLRTLHAAFRRFRGTTPLAALHAFRLDAVHAALGRGIGRQTVGEIARQHGFSNRTRFVAAYVRRFGELPKGQRGGS